MGLTDLQILGGGRPTAPPGSAIPATRVVHSVDEIFFGFARSLSDAVSDSSSLFPFDVAPNFPIFKEKYYVIRYKQRNKQLHMKQIVNFRFFDAFEKMVYVGASECKKS